MKRATMTRPRPARRPPLITAIRHDGQERITYHFDEVAWGKLRLILDTRPDGTQELRGAIEEAR